MPQVLIALGLVLADIFADFSALLQRAVPEVQDITVLSLRSQRRHSTSTQEECCVIPRENYMFSSEA